MAWCSNVASSTSDRRDEPATTAEQRNSVAMDGFLGVCRSSLRLQDGTADYTRGGSFRRYLAARARRSRPNWLADACCEDLAVLPGARGR